MDTNAGRNMVINEHNKWYYFAYVINGCDIDCDNLHEAIENLQRHVRTIYSYDDVIDINNFEHVSVYDGLDACSLLDIINSTEMYFICDTDAMKGGEN